MSDIRHTTHPTINPLPTGNPREIQKVWNSVFRAAHGPHGTVPAITEREVNDTLSGIYAIREAFEYGSDQWMACCAWAQEVIERERASRQ